MGDPRERNYQSLFSELAGYEKKGVYMLMNGVPASPMQIVQAHIVLDLGPASKGHALILPKNHYRNLYDIDEATASKAICLAKKMITKMTDILGCDGYNIVQNNEEAAGQTVFHFHMHLIPRYKNDNVGLGWHMGELTEEDKKEILEKLK